jgi:hypothetical protein
LYSYILLTTRCCMWQRYGASRKEQRATPA